MESKKIDFQEIVNVVLREMRITEGQAIGKSRKREIVMARQVCWYLGLKHTKITQSALGGRFGKDHATVFHGRKLIQNLIDTNYKDIPELINYIEGVLGLKEEAITPIARVYVLSNTTFLIELDESELKENKLEGINPNLVKAELSKILLHMKLYNRHAIL